MVERAGLTPLSVPWHCIACAVDRYAPSRQARGVKSDVDYIHNNILDTDHYSDQCWTYLRPLALPPFSMATRTNSNQSPLPIITCPVCGQRMRLSTIMPEDEYRERMTFVCECGFDYRHANAVRAERGML